MGTYNAFYIRTEKGIDLSDIRANFSKSEIMSKGEFAGVVLGENDFEVPERELMELSEKYKIDVFWLSFQSVVDAFQFHHWKDGGVVRSLVYGCFLEERTWERVEGRPGSWEKAVLFDPTALEQSLKWIEDDAEKEELKRIWTEGEVEVGRTEPGIDARDCAWKVAEYYGFPGWD